MKIFGKMYDQTMKWSRHRLAVYWLFFVSFIEAIFFPIPPDVMLIPMSMNNPKQALKYALYTALASLLGGLIGYAIGYYAYDFVHHYIVQFGYETKMNQVVSWFNQCGVLVLIDSVFSPIQYKV